jgi:uncharacterized protein YciU (UPF0263 family)
MGLDMYAYVAARAGQQDEFYEGAEWDEVHKEHRNPNVNRPREIAYWRKHPNLHGWMARLWLARENNALQETDNFNGIELELTAEDLDNLELAVKNKQLPSTSGFFFGNEADDYYRESDLKFIQMARAEMFLGLKVFYNSSW